ncbi:MAG TPA: aminotransferase class I/II-fold pyridoxal phosphate-dependent enzyme [Candidatus Dormibacteraeota bacterium]
MKRDSRAVHAGRELKPRDPLAPPIVQTAVYVYDDLDDYDAVARGDSPGHVYARNSSENTDWLERAVADLEGAEGAVATGSGMAAILLALLALTPEPKPLLVQRELYGVTLALLRQDFAPRGYELRYADFADLDQVRQGLPGAGLLICETITNPLCKVVDLEAVCRLAVERQVPVLVDNTFASPALFRPLAVGATATVHSATKYIGGHSDLTAGVVAAGAALVKDMRARGVRMGTTLGPFEAWLALRGLRTLGLRMARHSTNSVRLAEGLAGLDAVERVHHPLLEGSPWEATARRLLPEGSGGMMAFDLAGGREAVQGMLGRLRLVRFAASLAGVETTISYPDLTSHRSLPPEERLALGITPGTVRVSVGIEDPEDVLEDFRQAIAR